VNWVVEVHGAEVGSLPEGPYTLGRGQMRVMTSMI